MSANTKMSAVNGGTGSIGTPANNGANNVGGTRRASQEGTMFSGLMNHKRNSQDAAAAARRQSFNEMKPAPGFIGQMWQNFTQGSDKK
ncbi:hypothetical protein BP5796_07440 [Coleophoma crateriformis]|uniref:Conidiation-specific protein 8 n=1 Tax=Coleophoma crateriformis TaxID=565419 RepID=A0A3D8RJ92_9HELO|nr:hypothetical protein BP5796_07440 [Coleophoma crateriformis]